MAELGKLNTLRVVKEVPFGVYLDGGEKGEILLPTKYLPKDCKPGDMVEVFIYLDSEDDLIATTRKPNALLGEFALLKVVSLTAVGAFLDWGLQKDLLVPFGEQKVKMQEGKSYIVYLYLDNTGRITASSKIDKFLDKQPPDYQEGQQVDLLICERSDIGLKAIVNNRHWGVLFEDEVFEKLHYGAKVKGFIKKVRPDNKIDLHFHKPGHEKLGGCADKVLAELHKKHGFLPLNDKSSPEVIYKLFGESKKTFKSAIGMLYKKRLISIADDGIRLIE